MNGQYVQMRNSGGLGTGVPFVGGDKMWEVGEQFIGGVDVGQGVMGRDMPAGHLLCEYVGTVMDDDEYRAVGNKDYSVALPEPLDYLLIDAGPPRERGAAGAAAVGAAGASEDNEQQPVAPGQAPRGGAVCIAGKLNDSVIVKPRKPWRAAAAPASMPSQVSNGEGDSQYRCTDGVAANCAFITAQCTGCGAMPGVRLTHFHHLIYTLRAISSAPGGEPLFISYGTNYWPTQVIRMRCADLIQKNEALEQRVKVLQTREDAVANRELEVRLREAELNMRELEMSAQPADLPASAPFASLTAPR